MMQHCGRDLNNEWFKYMQNRQLAETIEFKRKIADMSLQIFDSLVCLHKVGFCHWDLKLDNICFFKDQYYLIDFAFA